MPPPRSPRGGTARPPPRPASQSPSRRRWTRWHRRGARWRQRAQSLLRAPPRPSAEARARGAAGVLRCAAAGLHDHEPPPVGRVRELRSRVGADLDRLVAREEMPLLVHDGLVGTEIDGALPAEHASGGLLELVAAQRDREEVVPLHLLPVSLAQDLEAVEPALLELRQELLFRKRAGDALAPEHAVDAQARGQLRLAHDVADDDAPVVLEHPPHL